MSFGSNGKNGLNLKISTAITLLIVFRISASMLFMESVPSSTIVFLASTLIINRVYVKSQEKNISSGPICLTIAGGLYA